MTDELSDREKKLLEDDGLEDGGGLPDETKACLLAAINGMGEALEKCKGPREAVRTLCVSVSDALVEAGIAKVEDKWRLATVLLAGVTALFKVFQKKAGLGSLVKSDDEMDAEHRLQDILKHMRKGTDTIQ